MVPNLIIKAVGLISIVCMLIDTSSCDNHTYYYRISAVITNRNYTQAILDPESSDRKNLTNEIRYGLRKIYELLKSRYKEKHGELKKVMMKEIYFGSPSHPEEKNTSLIAKARNKFVKSEEGIYFLSSIHLEFNISKPEGSEQYVHDIRQLLNGIINNYFNNYIRDNLLGYTLRLDLKTLHSEEVSLEEARRLEDIVRYKNGYDSKLVHQSTNVSKKDRDVLAIISYVGCSVSMLGLLVTIVTILISRKLRRVRANQILIQMCTSLLGALMFYSFGIQQLKDDSMIETCKAISAMLHYFILASMIWASIEAYNLYQDLVKVFDTSSLSHNEFMCRASLAGWVPPGVIVGVTVLVSKRSYGFHVPDEDHTFCWLSVEAFYGALLSPILVLVVGNTIIFIIVMREIFKMPQAHEKHSKMSQFRATISVFTLLGLNWVFSGLAAATPILVFQYLFTITCSFQGFFIFILHGVMKKDFREVWGSLTSKNRVMGLLRSSNSQSQKTTSSSVSQNSTGNQHSGSFSNPCNVSFARMPETDSGIDVQKQ